MPPKSLSPRPRAPTDPSATPAPTKRKRTPKRKYVPPPTREQRIEQLKALGYDAVLEMKRKVGRDLEASPTSVDLIVELEFLQEVLQLVR